MLYVVPTPIGNLQDMTFRAVETLQSVDIILAEDTRTSGRLLKHYAIETPMESYHAHNEHKKVNYYTSLLSGGTDMAIITDAGMPGISDPGFLLIRSCLEQGVKVSCLPGANAFLPALVASGIPSDKFFFEGFLPHKKGRHTRLKILADLPYTFILYESPYRLLKCLEQLQEHCGGGRIASVAREISKLHEEFITETLDNLIDNFKSRDSIKGEIVITVSGKPS